MSSKKPEDPSARAKQIQDIFQLATGPNRESCDPYKDQLQTYYTDSLTLLEHGLWLVDQAKDKSNPKIQGIAKKILSFLLGATSNDDYDRVRPNYKQVYDYLVGKIPDKRGKPFLFCGCHLVPDKEWDDTGLEKAGVRSKKTIRELYEGKGRRIIGNAQPYWSPYHNEYFAYSPDDYKNYTGVTEAIGGVTMESNGDLPIKPAYICIYPIKLRFGKKEDPIIDDGKTEAQGKLLSWFKPAVGKSLKLYKPVGSTLMHEAFHLVLGGEATGDLGLSSFAELIEIAKGTSRSGRGGFFRPDTLMGLPEAYVNAALAAYYLKNANIDFSSSIGEDIK